jgi:glutamine synthetase
MLSPELSTLREMPWQKKEAIVLADVCHPDTGEVIPYSPRNIMKETAKMQKGPIDTSIMFSFVL